MQRNLESHAEESLVWIYVSKIDSKVKICTKMIKFTRLHWTEFNAYSKAGVLKLLTAEGQFRNPKFD